MIQPPDDLKAWSKNELVREVRRLRAITREHASTRGDDPRAASSEGAVVDVAGDPYARGGAVFDARNAVLLASSEVMLVDTKREDEEPLVMMLSMAGRVNYSPDNVEHVYLLGTDGAAALVSEILGLAHRAGGEFRATFLADFNRRMDALP